MAWNNTALTLAQCFDSHGELLPAMSDKVCVNDYKVSRKTNIFTIGLVTYTEIRKTVDASYVITGMTEAAAKQTADNLAWEQKGFFAQARKAYASDGWEVSVTRHNTFIESSSTQPVGGGTT